jgi:lysine-specific demethylase 8
MPDPEDFFRQYVFERRPVVITNLFERQDVSTIITIDDATRAWGTMPIHLQAEYTSAERTTQPPDPIFMPFSDYVAFTRSNRSTRLCCTEYDTPARVLASFQLPSVCSVLRPAGDEIFGLPRKYGDFDLASNTFIANEGNVAHLHFDGDQREVLLHQVYGRKRVVLFQPAAAIHLSTLDGPWTRPSLSGLYLEDMYLEDKLSLVDFADGYHTVLEPGETIYIPMLMWHHLEYLDDAMSFSIRFGRTRFGRFLSLDNFHRDPYLQNVASKMVGPEDVLGAFDPIIDDIRTAYRRPTPDMRQKVREIRALFRGLCAHLCSDACAESLCPPEREEEQISRIVEGKDMEGGLKYADPAVIARTRPVGAITARQRQIIQDRMRTHGYSREVEQAVISNRIGKADVDELSKVEAAQLIAYLNTPGAAWQRHARTQP